MERIFQDRIDENRSISWWKAENLAVSKYNLRLAVDILMISKEWGDLVFQYQNKDFKKWKYQNEGFKRWKYQNESSKNVKRIRWNM